MIGWQFSRVHSRTDMRSRYVCVCVTHVNLCRFQVASRKLHVICTHTYVVIVVGRSILRLGRCAMCVWCVHNVSLMTTLMSDVSETWNRYNYTKKRKDNNDDAYHTEPRKKTNERTKERKTTTKMIANISNGTEKRTYRRSVLPYNRAHIIMSTQNTTRRRTTHWRHGATKLRAMSERENVARQTHIQSNKWIPEYLMAVKIRRGVCVCERERGREEGSGAAHWWRTRVLSTRALQHQSFTQMVVYMRHTLRETKQQRQRKAIWMNEWASDRIKFCAGNEWPIHTDARKRKRQKFCYNFVLSDDGLVSSVSIVMCTVYVHVDSECKALVCVWERNEEIMQTLFGSIIGYTQTYIDIHRHIYSFIHCIFHFDDKSKCVKYSYWSRWQGMTNEEKNGNRHKDVQVQNFTHARTLLVSHMSSHQHYIE